MISRRYCRPVPVRSAEAVGAEPLSVVGTVAGRAFSSGTIVEVPLESGAGRRLWLPLLNGTERLGVMEMLFGDAADCLPEATLALCERYAHLVAMSVVTKTAYGDDFEIVRRRQPMTIASELLWQLVPPLAFATDDLVIAGLLEPCYDNGGDAFDYAVNRGMLHAAVFDAMGHGLPAAGAAAFALSAYRHSRRCGDALVKTYAAMDSALSEQFWVRFVTALIAELEIASGRFCWLSAGHPATASGPSRDRCR